MPLYYLVQGTLFTRPWLQTSTVAKTESLHKDYHELFCHLAVAFVYYPSPHFRYLARLSMTRKWEFRANVELSKRIDTLAYSPIIYELLKAKVFSAPMAPEIRAVYGMAIGGAIVGSNRGNGARRSKKPISPDKRTKNRYASRSSNRTDTDLIHASRSRSIHQNLNGSIKGSNSINWGGAGIWNLGSRSNNSSHNGDNGSNGNHEAM